MMACERCHEDTVALLLERGALVNAHDNVSQLGLPTYCYFSNCVCMIQCGETVLMAAARSTLAIVKMLVYKGADIHATDKVGTTSAPVPRDIFYSRNMTVNRTLIAS